MKVQLLLESEYTPEWNDNREQTTPIVCVLVPLNSERRMACWNIQITDDGQSRISPDLAQYFRYGVKEIRNLEDEEGPLKTAAEVLRSRGEGLEGLIRECGMEVFIRNTSLPKKK